MADEKSPLAKAIDAQNELARKAPPRAAPATVTVRVLQRARFNGAGHKAIGWREAGEIIGVAAGDYADALVAAGLVERYVVPEPVESPADAPPPPPPPPPVAPRHAQQQQRAPRPRRSK